MHITQASFSKACHLLAAASVGALSFLSMTGANASLVVERPSEEKTIAQEISNKAPELAGAVSASAAVAQAVTAKIEPIEPIEKKPMQAPVEMAAALVAPTASPILSSLVTLVTPAEIAMPSPAAQKATEEITSTYMALAADGTVQNTLARWADAEHWEVIWKGIPSINSVGTAKIPAKNFLDAADYLLGKVQPAAKAAGIELSTVAYPDNVLVISNSGSKKVSP